MNPLPVRLFDTLCKNSWMKIHNLHSQSPTLSHGGGYALVDGLIFDDDLALSVGALSHRLELAIESVEQSNNRLGGSNFDN